MASTQMNVRIDETIKAAGDEVFARLGYNPTNIIRVIWEYAALNADNPDQIETMLRNVERALNPDADAERTRKMQLAEAGPKEFSRFLAKMGIDNMPKFTSESISPEDIREQAALDRAREKGRIDE